MTNKVRSVGSKKSPFIEVCKFENDILLSYLHKRKCITEVNVLQRQQEIGRSEKKNEIGHRHYQARLNRSNV